MKSEGIWQWNTRLDVKRKKATTIINIAVKEHQNSTGNTHWKQDENLSALERGWVHGTVNILLAI